MAARRRSLALAASAALGLAGCAARDGHIATYQPPAGSNQVLSGPIASDPGHSLIVGDLVMKAGGNIPRHRHTGEEFLYVIGGSTVISREGEPDIVLKAGQGVRIAPGTVHWGHAGPDGVRAISSWVAADGQPLREQVP